MLIVNHSTILSITFYNLSISFISVFRRYLLCFYAVSFFLNNICNLLFSSSKYFFSDSSYCRVQACWLIICCNDCFSLWKVDSQICFSDSKVSFSLLISILTLSVSDELSLAYRSYFLRESLISEHYFSLALISFFKEFHFILNLSRCDFSYKSLLLS